MPGNIEIEGIEIAENNKLFIDYILEIESYV
jgi:hypothetical protein